MTTLDQDEVLYTLLCKYMLHEADAGERRQVEEWLQQDPQHPVLLARLEKLLAGLPEQVALTHADTDGAWERLQAAMALLAEQEQTADQQPVTRRITARWWLAAAVIAALISIGIWRLNSHPALEQLYTGPVTATLEDGTTIQLEADAELRVLPHYNRPERSATLTGKAVFNVTPNAGHPFNLLLGNRLVQVLGTRFRISYTPGTNTLRIHVDTGAVMVKDSARKDSILLTSGMLLAAEGQAPARVAAHIADVEKKQLVFTDTPLKEVLATVDVVYNMTVTADTSLLRLPVTATFTGETADNVLQAVAFMTNTVVARNGPAISLVKQP